MSSIRNFVYELPHDLSNNLKMALKKLENIGKVPISGVDIA